MKLRVELPDKYESATVILPVLNETYSLRSTVEILQENDSGLISRFLVVVSPKTSPESNEVIAELRETSRIPLDVLVQTRPFLGGAMQDAFEALTTSHAVMMASDLETNPRDAAAMLELAKAHPQMIITASRWRQGGSFAGYNKAKLIANWIFQHFFSVLFGTDLTDMTYGYRVFPTPLLRQIKWEAFRHPFLFESMLKPLRLGVKVIEIPSAWSARTEGTSSNAHYRNFAYFPLGFKIRFRPIRDLLK